MKIEDTHIKKAVERINVPEPEAGQPTSVISLTATIEDNELMNIEISSLGKEFSIMPSGLYTQYYWSYLEKLAKFLNEVLKLRKKQT